MSSMNNDMLFLNCKRCMREMPDGTSASEWSRASVGLNENGELEAWCNRYDTSIAVLTKRGRIVPAIAEAKCAECGKSGPHKH